MARLKHHILAPVLALVVGIVLLGAPLSVFGNGDAVAQGVKVPKLDTTRGFRKGTKAVGSGGGAGGVTQGGSSGNRIAAAPVNFGRSVSNLTGADRWGRADKRFTGQRCEAMENGVRVMRGC